MNSLIFVTLAVVLAVANAGLLGLGGVGLVGSGIEGQYIPSGLERLSDDGSYRAEHHLAGAGLGLGLGVAGHGLGLGLAGPGVLLARGSGLTGQYVPSGLEQLSDDGSYRAEHHLAGHNLILH